MIFLVSASDEDRYSASCDQCSGLQCLRAAAEVDGRTQMAVDPAISSCRPKRIRRVGRPRNTLAALFPLNPSTRGRKRLILSLSAAGS
jgi:hypothetical protein